MRRRAAAAVAVAALAGGLLWLRGHPAAGRAGGPNVLLITVDTLRADALGAYGRPDAMTPWMDRLGAEGVRFVDAHAHNVVTLPSHANILSGRLPTEHGVHDNAGFRFPSRLETLATLLHDRGYRTGAFVSAFPLASRFGLARGFEVYDDRFLDAGTRPAFLEQERAGPQTVAAAARWLQTAGDGPWFCWVHLYEPHFPYAPPPPLAVRFAGDLYQGEVAAADAALAPLLEPIVAARDQGRTLVVLTADHGESLGEHGETSHGIFAYEATLRVPLVLYQPRLLAPRVVAAPARHVDLLPTILDALGQPAPAGLPGRSLLPVAKGGTDAAPETPTYFEALSGQLNRGWAPLHGVLRGGMKYVELPHAELYDLRRDPREQENLAAAQTARRDELRAALAAFRTHDDVPRRQPEGAEVRERLRSLGYLGTGAGPARTDYTEEDDPKRLIALDAELQRIAGLFAAGDRDAALTRARALVQVRPGMTVALLYLAQLERESGRVPAAVAALEQALAVDPDDTVVAALLGACLSQAGRARDAAALLEPYARREEPDLDVLVARALALAKLGQTEPALATLARAREADPSNAMVLVDVGTVHLMARDAGRAREAFEAALGLNPDVARAHSSLAFIAAEEGRPAEALDRFQRAVAIDPREHEKLLALGLLFWQRGRTEEARPYLDLFVTSAPPGRYGREIERARGLLALSPRPRG